MTDSPGSKVATRQFRTPREYATALGYERDIMRATVTILYPHDYPALKRVLIDRVKALVTEMVRRGDYYCLYPHETEDGRAAGLALKVNGHHIRWVSEQDGFIHLRGLEDVDGQRFYRSGKDWIMSDNVWHYLMVSRSMIRYRTNLGNEVRVYPYESHVRLQIQADRDQLPFRELLVPLLESRDAQITTVRTRYPDWPITRTTKDHRDNYAALEDEQEIEFGMMVRENALRSIS